MPARFFDAATLERETPRLRNPSDVVFAEVGCHGVAEGAAMAAAGLIYLGMLPFSVRSFNRLRREAEGPEEVE